MRVVFEELRRGFVRFRAYDRVGSQFIAYIIDTALSDLLGLTERSTHADDRTLVLFDPGLPCSNPLAFLCSPLRFGKGVPRLPAGAGFAAKKNRKICVVHAHNVSFPLPCCRLKQKLDVPARITNSFVAARSHRHLL